MTDAFPTGPLGVRGDVPSLLAFDPYSPPGAADLAFMGLEGLRADLPAEKLDVPIGTLDAMLADRSASFTRRAQGHCRRHPVSEIHYPTLLLDDVTRGMLDALETSPAAVAMLTRSTDEMHLVAQEEGVEIPIGIDHLELADGDPTCDHHACLSLRLPLGRGITWTPGRIEGALLPDTIGAVVAGMALRDIVSHPLLDAHDLVVTDWDEGGLDVDMTGRTSSVWRVDRRHRNNRSLPVLAQLRGCSIKTAQPTET